MKAAELLRLCDLWQRRLRLQDWTIEVEVVPRHELKRDACAHSFLHRDVKQAEVRIGHPSGYGPEDNQDDVEQVLVHELLHIHFNAFDCPDDDSAEFLTQEASIDALATALVTLARGEEVEARARRPRSTK